MGMQTLTIEAHCHSCISESWGGQSFDPAPSGLVSVFARFGGWSRSTIGAG